MAKENHSIPSRVAGFITGGILGVLTAEIIFNPMANLWALCRGFLGKPKKLLNPVYLLIAVIVVPLLFAILVPITPILGFLYGATAGWKYGILKSFMKAPSKVYDKIIYHNKKEYLRNGLPPQPALTPSDIIFALIAGGLVTFIVLSILFPAIFGFPLITSLIAYFGLAGLNTSLIAFIVGLGASLLAFITYAISPAVISMCIATLTSLIIYNPIASIFMGLKLIWQDKSVENFIVLCLSPIASPIVMLVFAAIGFISGIVGGMAGSIVAPMLLLKAALSPRKDKHGEVKSPYLTVNDVIASLVILGLMATVCFAIIFPAAFGLTAVLPPLLSLIGFGSLNTWALALIVGLVTFAITSIGYGLLNSYCCKPKVDLANSPHQNKSTDRSEQMADSTSRATRLLTTRDAKNPSDEHMDEHIDRNTAGLPGHHTTSPILARSTITSQLVSEQMHDVSAAPQKIM